MPFSLAVIIGSFVARPLANKLPPRRLAGVGRVRSRAATSSSHSPAAAGSAFRSAS